MHDIHDESNVVPALATAQKDCISCGKTLPMIFFRRDSSYRDGRRDQCQSCQDSPRLSTEEHVYRLREMNANSEAIKRQRWVDQDDFRNEAARRGRVRHHSEIMRFLREVARNLYFTDGRIAGDIAVFRVYGQPQPRLEGRDFEYLFYIPTGWLPEFSLIEFDHRDVPVKEKQRGWRTVLLRLIQSNLVSEEQCDEFFGEPSGEAARQWRKQLFAHRNGHD